MRPQDNGPKVTDDPLNVIAMIAVGCFLAYFGWMTVRPHVNALLGAISWVHVFPFAYAAEQMPSLLNIPVLGNWIFAPCVKVAGFLEKGGYAVMTGEQRWLVLTASGRIAGPFWAAVLVFLTLKGGTARVDVERRKIHSLESLIHEQSEHWVTSRHARHIDPLKGVELSGKLLADTVGGIIKDDPKMPGVALPRRVVDILPGAEHRALRPEEWVLARGLIFDPQVYNNMKDVPGDAGEEAFRFEHQWEKLDILVLGDAFASQLRDVWEGPEKLRPCLRAIYAVMACFYSFETKKGNTLLSEIAIIADSVQFKPGSMDKALVAEKRLMAKIDKIAFGKEGALLCEVGNKHAYVESALPAMLAAAREERGVLPTSAFLWLKGEDRTLWYILNNTGNEANMTEAAGALGHMKAEAQVGRPLYSPRVYQPARAMLEDYLDQTPERQEKRAALALLKVTPDDQVRIAEEAMLGAKEKEDIDGIYNS